MEQLPCIYLKQYRFHLTFGNIPILAENQQFQQIVLGVFLVFLMFLIYCPFYTNTYIDMQSFVMRSWPFPVLFNMRYMMIQSMVADISSFLSKGHDTAAACNYRE